MEIFAACLPHMDGSGFQELGNSLKLKMFFCILFSQGAEGEDPARDHGVDQTAEAQQVV